MSLVVISAKTLCKVSSVLNNDVKQYGKQHLFDNSLESCWNSDQGSPQEILLAFQECVDINEVRITFQGGFVGKDCKFYTSTDGKSYSLHSDFYPVDVSSMQQFKCETSAVKRLKIVFESSTDFYGRITIYQLDVIGKKSAQ
eukprot:TRINITY_DN2936_c0_g1_i2.p1 TRINITY_DN2936_c0_g1~~TRINITY_DN2936_c0_g1_i2.p1  ORF type:complete len:142 (+),score=19.83 TRINITY_DN2936_c0_g1_i2:34-459(+)